MIEMMLGQFHVVVLTSGFLLSRSFCCGLPTMFANASTSTVDPDFNSSSAQSSTSPHVTSSSTRRCFPVAHDILWRQLSEEDSAFYRHDISEIDIDIDDIDDDDDDSDISPLFNFTDGRRSESNVNTTSSPRDSMNDLLQTGNGSNGRAARSRSNARRRSTGRRNHRQEKRRQLQQRRRRLRPGRRTESGRKSGAVDAADPASRHFRRSTWQCRLEKRWKRTPPGTFPAYVQTGRCRRLRKQLQTCMMGLYECQPRRYRVKLLRRLEPTDCRPVPTVGPEVLYEEAWSFVDFPVTVACECSRRRAVGTYAIGNTVT